MYNILLVGIGGFIGSILRYLVNLGIYRLLEYPTFPFGTMIVNLTGCLIIGLLGGFAENRAGFSPELRLFLFIGILGGYTTFSSFGYDTLGLLRDSQLFYAFLNVAVQVVVGMAAVWIGFAFSRNYF